jgi:cytochrome c553
MKKILILFVISVSLYGTSTLCYKKNYSDVTNIEKQIFDGGKCLGKYSIKDMQMAGWNIEDISVKDLDNGNYDFVYVLKQINNQLEEKNIDYKQLALKTEAVKKEKKANDDYNEAIRKYKLHCVSCHGKKGEIESYGTSRKLTALTKEEFVELMYEYRIGEVDRGNAIMMRPSAPFTDENLDGYIYEYLQNINK